MKKQLQQKEEKDSEQERQKRVKEEQEIRVALESRLNKVDCLSSE